MKRTVICILAVAILLPAFCMSTFAQSPTKQLRDFVCDYSAEAKDGYYLNYGSTSVTKLTSAEADDRGVPAGYTNDVLLVEHNNTSMGILLDFSSLKLPYKLIKSLTFRVYVCDDGLLEDDYPEVRIIKPGSGSWVMRFNVKKQTNQWVDVTLDCDGGNFQSGRNFSDLSVDGLLDRFELSVRANQGETYFYIDSISYTLLSDTTPPVMQYDGEPALYFPTDAKFELPISAYDDEEGRALEVQYTWSDPNAMRLDGTLNKGCYTLTAIATNFTGLSSTLTFTVVVGDEDTTPPMIAIDVTEMHLPIGTVPMLSPVATDDTGYVKINAYWSQDALDSTGRLTEGIHLYTIRAADLSGNESVKTVIVYVSSEASLGDYVIDEQNGLIVDNRPSNPPSDQDAPTDAPSVNDPFTENPSQNDGKEEENGQNDDDFSGIKGVFLGILIGFFACGSICWVIVMKKKK